jgi:pSer/pThr/pTyr-binding forkhead associated (FHA) protein
MFRVTMTFGGKPVRKFTFDQPTISIGRDASCEIVVENIGASRRHATIEKTPEGYILSDLKSHNGTFVGGQKVFHHQLRDMDEFFIGKYAFQFETLDPVAVEVKPEAAPSLPVAADMTFRLDRKDIERIIGTSQRGAATQLVQLAPDSERKTTLLDKAYYVIGRHPSAEIRMTGRLAPRKAGVIVKGEHAFRLLALTRRLKVNGRFADDSPLADGDLIEIGRRRWRFCQA